MREKTNEMGLNVLYDLCGVCAIMYVGVVGIGKPTSGWKLLEEEQLGIPTTAYINVNESFTRAS
jgi:hypothetical protein